MSQYSFPLISVDARIAMAQSLIEVQQPFGEQIPTHFQEWFSGDALDSIWTFEDIVGSGSVGMNDIINGGVRITCGTTSSDSSVIDFNDIDHYSATGSKFICVCKLVESTSRFTYSGFYDDPSVSIANQRLTFGNDSVNSEIALRTGDVSATGETAGITTVDENLHAYQVEINSILSKMYTENGFEAVRTATLPTVDLQPVLRVGTRTGAARNIDVLYFEAWNTEV